MLLVTATRCLCMVTPFYHSRLHTHDVAHPLRFNSSRYTHGKIFYIRSGTDTFHYSDVIMGAMAHQITSLTIVYSTIYSGADQRKHQSSASLAFVRGIHRWQVNSPHKGPVTRKMSPLDDVIMIHHYRTFVSVFSISEDEQYVPLLVFSSGSIWHVSPTTVKVQCNGNGDPSYDCIFKLGSWTYDGSKVALIAYGGDTNGLDMSTFQPHPRWNVTSATAARNVHNYDCCPEPYHDWQMNITITDLYA